MHLKLDWTKKDSDGCTFWPDGNYVSCCHQHDEEYAHGGSWLDRIKSNWKLAKCVKKSGHPVVAPIMFAGVTVFGSFLWPYHLRWKGSKKLKRESHD